MLSQAFFFAREQESGTREMTTPHKSKIFQEIPITEAQQVFGCSFTPRLIPQPLHGCRRQVGMDISLEGVRRKIRFARFHREPFPQGARERLAILPYADSAATARIGIGRQAWQHLHDEQPPGPFRNT